MNLSIIKKYTKSSNTCHNVKFSFERLKELQILSVIGIVRANASTLVYHSALLITQSIVRAII